jgi:SMC interacting uncharacterized protein involved in chromosome segregation
MKSQLRDNQMDTDTHQTTKTTNNFTMDQLEELYETVRILSNGAQTLNEDRQRLNSELLEHQTKLQSLTDNASQVQVAVEEENAALNRIKKDVETLSEDLFSLKEKIDDMQYISYDGTFTWKITNFQEKMGK